MSAELVLPEEYVLCMGYYPDAFVAHGMPPDVFFVHVDMAKEKGVETVTGYAEVVLDAADALVSACTEKYKLKRGAWSAWDCFWSVTTR